MNTLVEKALGIMVFAFFFVPFAFGLYVHSNNGFEFNKVTSEINQMVKEDGGYWNGSKAYNYVNGEYNSASLIKEKKELDATPNKNTQEYQKRLENYNKRVEGATLVKRGYVVKVEKLTNGSYTDISSATQANGKLKVGDKVRVSIDYKAKGILGWKPANFTKINEITNYKR